MEQRRKTPPINISELKKEEVSSQRGPLSYVDEDKKKLTGNSPKKIDVQQVLISAVISLLLVLLLTTTMSASKRDALTLLDNQKELETRLAATSDSVSAQVGRIDSVINTMGEYAKKSDLSNVDLSGMEKSISGILGRLDGLEDYEGKIDGLISRIEALEVEEEAEEEAATVEECRWDAHAYLSGGSSGSWVDVNVIYPRIIEEEDYYELELEYEVLNLDSSWYLSVELTPRDRGAKVYIDEDNTWIEIIGHHTGEWDMDVRTNRDGSVRKITFEYPYKLNQLSEILELELCLTYK